MCCLLIDSSRNVRGDCMKLKKIFCFLLTLCFLFGCSESNDDSSSNKKSEPKTKVLTLTNNNIVDFLEVEYTSSVRDCSYNRYMKTVRYTVDISSYDSKYKFNNVVVKINNKEYEVDNGGNVETFTFEKDVSNLDETFVVPPVVIQEVRGSVVIPNETFTISMYVDGVLEQKLDVLYGVTPDITYTPEKEGYYFKGWSQTVTRVKQNVSINAVFLEEVTVTYMIDDDIYKTMKYGKGMSLGEENDFVLSNRQGETFTYWYENDYRKPYNFEKTLNGDVTLNALYKLERYCHGSESGTYWNLTYVNANDCVVPRTYGGTFKLAVYSSGNQEIKLKTSSSNINLNNALILAIDGGYHNNNIAGGPKVTVVGKGKSLNNDPYLTIKTTEDGWYYFVCLSQMNLSIDIKFDIEAEILNVY